MKLPLCLLLLTFLLLCHRYGTRFRTDQLTLLFFDVGQGDGALVQFPGGAVWMVDAGGGFKDWDLGDRELFAELTRRGVLHIDVALLSHSDEDHAMGYRGLFEQLTVGSWWVHERQRRKPVVQELEYSAWHHRIPVNRLRAETTGVVNGATYRVIPIQTRSENSNDLALVLKVSFAGCDALFTGDIESEGEAYLSQQRIGPVEFLKVAHHGSRTSSSVALLRQLRPQLAVISAGRENRYGHPHPQVTSRLRRIGAEVLATPVHGYVELDISRDGTWRCQSYQGDCGTGRCQK